MPSEEAKALAESRRGLVIAPAGCGKTFLLAEAVSCSTGRQLVLTHTHAGVRAIRGHLDRHKVPSSKYGVVTIDGLALRYACAFPTLSGWSVAIPTGSDWKPLREAARRVLQRSAIRRVLSATYSGVFVDEYQDCSEAQHQLIMLLTEFMPVRVVGDPLQAIFALLDRDNYCRWQDVEAIFSCVAELNTPHRWNTNNDALGKWLLEVRRLLLEGKGIDLRDSPVIWQEATCQRNQTRLKACFGIKAKKDHSVIALRKWRSECNSIARNLKGRYRAMETVECEELLNWSERIDKSSGASRVKETLEFAETCMAGLPAAVKGIGERLGKGEVPRPKRSDFQRVCRAAQKVQGTDDLNCVLTVMDSLTALTPKPVLARHELWREMRRTLREHQISPSSSLRQTAWNLRNRLRHIGGRVDRVALGTPLLVKGLEFDHALILDAADHGEAESLYVAMTRGSRTLTIVSEKPVLIRPKPHFMLHNGAFESPGSASAGKADERRTSDATHP